jgi:hypothetical protein
MDSSHEGVIEALDGFVSEFDIERPPDYRAKRGADESVLKLVEREGVLLVDEGGGRRPSARNRGTRGGDDVIWQSSLEKLEQAQVGAFLEKLDKKLTPHQGLRRLHEGSFVEGATVPTEGRVLLLVHGTFSNGESFINGLKENPDGDAFLGWCDGSYDAVLSFDHPTLSVSPMLNAHALSHAFAGSSAATDVICHSRGGLVTRWYLEALHQGNPADNRAVFVGSPLAGTGLAAPPNIKGSLSLLSNIGSAIGTAASLIPFGVVVGGIFKVVSSVTKLAARTPAIDAAVALIPGLIAQSRVGNNAELLSQRRSVAPIENRYFGVEANFESEQVGWKFWKYFRDIGGRAMDIGADVVFEGANDLVVDTGSMTEFSADVKLPADQVLDFGTTDKVHHTNYFHHAETVAFIREKLSQPR